MTSVPRVCAGCDKVITPGPRERNRRKWCSETCRVRAHSIRTGYTPYQKRPPASPISYATCTECDRLFVVRRPERSGNAGLVCRDVACRRERTNRTQREWSARYREKHGRAYTTDLNPESRKAANARRRAVLAGARTADVFTNDEIFNRDGWVCQLCGEPVDSGLEWPHPMYKSLDHRVPLNRGGAHTKDNVQLAHLSCNARKGDREEVA